MKGLHRSILDALVRIGRPASHRELEEELPSRRSSIASALKELHAIGLVVRVPCVRDLALWTTPTVLTSMSLGLLNLAVQLRAPGGAGAGLSSIDSAESISEAMRTDVLPSPSVDREILRLATTLEPEQAVKLYEHVGQLLRSLNDLLRDAQIEGKSAEQVREQLAHHIDTGALHVARAFLRHEVN